MDFFRKGQGREPQTEKEKEGNLLFGEALAQKGRFFVLFSSYKIKSYGLLSLRV